MTRTWDRGRLRTWGMAIVFVLLAVRVGSFIADVAEKSLQMDFSAFYAAGRSANAGLSPYVNHVDRSPPIWDGVDLFRHSRFLYPPLVARLFQPFALLPYAVAKRVWMLLCVAALGGALWLAARLAGVERKPFPLLVVGSVAAAFFPVLTLLERGQLDSILLFLLLLAVGWTRGPRTGFAAGAVLALATLLKLHCAFLLPFVLARRQWRVAGGFLAGGAALLLLSLTVDGPARLSGYLTNELPRISRYGEGGSREMRLPAETVRPLAALLASGRTVMDGREYDLERLHFVLNASAVRTPLGHAVWSALRRLGLGLAPGHVSLVFLGVAVVGLLAWQRRNGCPEGPDVEVWELVYWQIVLVVILLCAPVTWAMGTVWLLPAAAILVREAPRAKSLSYRFATASCALGLLIAGLPDSWYGAVIPPAGSSVLNLKYIVAELFCLGGLLGLWRLYRAGS